MPHRHSKSVTMLTVVARRLQKNRWQMGSQPAETRRKLEPSVDGRFFPLAAAGHAGRGTAGPAFLSNSTLAFVFFA